MANAETTGLTQHELTNMWSSNPHHPIVDFVPGTDLEVMKALLDGVKPHHVIQIGTKLFDPVYYGLIIKALEGRASQIQAVVLDPNFDPKGNTLAEAIEEQGRLHIANNLNLLCDRSNVHQEFVNLPDLNRSRQMISDEVRPYAQSRSYFNNEFTSAMLNESFLRYQAKSSLVSKSRPEQLSFVTRAL